MRVVDTMEDDQERGTGFGGTRDEDSDARLRARALALAARRKVKIKVGKGRPHGGISDRLFGLSNTGQYIRGAEPTCAEPTCPKGSCLGTYLYLRQFTYLSHFDLFMHGHVCRRNYGEHL